MVNKLFLTYGTPLMQQQVFKNRRLFSGERQLQSVGGGYACFGVEGNAAAVQNHVVLRELSSGQAAYSCLQLFQMKGLG